MAPPERARDAESLRRARLAAQGLDRGDTTPEAVVRRLLAVQGQDPRGLRLAVRSRSTGLSAADVDAALSERRSLVVGWLQRGTLHLVAAEDYWWLHALTAPRQVTGNRRRLAQEGVSPAQAERGVAVVAAEVADGPRTRAELQAALEAAGVPTAGQALVHVLSAASIEGRLVRGPMRGTHQCFVDPCDWIGPPEPLEQDDALARLARRYLEGHGPASPGDLATWAGVPLGQARAGFAAIADETRPWVAGPDGLVDLVDRPGAPPPPGIRLLGSFDPILHGWTSRELFVGEHQGVVTMNGIFRPTLLDRGRVAATWTLSGQRLEVRPFAASPPRRRTAIEAEGHDVLRYLGVDGGVVAII